MELLNQNKTLIATIAFVFIIQSIVLFNTSVFWYLYTFALLICMAIANIKTTFFDEMPTINYLVYGIGYGTIIYGFVRAGYVLLLLVYPKIDTTISSFLQIYGPANIWHYTILVFIIIIGEEMFWRGYVQQQFKKYFSPLISIVIASILFSISLVILGFIPGAFAALVAGFILGLLYEWKKSLPLIIVTHAVFVILLFLVLPLPV